MYKRTVSILFALALLLMAVPFVLNDVSAADSIPVFGSNLSDTTATTGDAFDFEINVTDDYTVTGVHVLYWYGTGTATNASMSLSGNNWTYQITIPSGSLDSLHYQFHAYDNATQWASYPSATTNVTQAVTDNDDPTYTDNSASVGTTGDSYYFDLTASDNIALQYVNITYSHNTVTGNNVAMTNDGDGTFSYAITLDHSTANLVYGFYIEDTSGNSVLVTGLTATVNDNDPPFVTNSSPGTGTTGDSYTFDIAATDNIGMSGMTITWSHGTLGGTDVAMTDDLDGTYSLGITLDDSIGSMTYTFSALDVSGNYANSTLQTVTVTDNDVPTMTDNSPGTGTTGDTYSFDVTASDNVGLSGVAVTWSHGSLGGTDVAMTDDLDGTWSLDITLDDSLSSLSYTITATDTSSNTASYSDTATVSDNDDPTIDADNSPGGTTADSYTFDITASDNIGVSGVTVTWSHDTSSGTNVAMTDDGDGTYSLTITLDDSTSDLTYTVTVTDTSTNTFTGSLQTVTVADNDDPTLDADISPTSGTTGDSYTFDVTASDNIGVSSVTVTWSHGSLGGTDVAMTDDGDGTYSLSITLDDSLSSMTYTVTVNDAAGNSISGSLQTVTVTDNDNPAIDADNSPSTGTTGDGYTFDVTASDNVAISSVTVTWSHGTLSGTNVALTDDGDGTYSLTITLDHSLSSMTYVITVTDTSTNFVVGSLMTVTVTDNDAPTFANPALNPDPPTTGDSVQISVDITDNIAVDNTAVTLYYDFGSGYATSTSFTESSGTYTFTVTASSDSTMVSYYVMADDTSANTGTSTTWTSSVDDNDDPSLDADNSPATGTTGDSYTFDITASDNIDVGGVNVLWSHGSLGTTTPLFDDGDGTWSGSITLDHSVSSMTYTVTVIDTSSNTDAGTLQTVTVSDNDKPTFTADQTPTPATTGDSFTFSIELDDNIDGTQVHSAYLLYCYGNDWTSTVNVTLSYVSGEGVWNGTITVIDTLSSIFYNISARDDAGNWQTWTGYFKPVMDNDAPTITGDTTQTSATTGDPFNFTMTAFDNIEVYRVYVSYAYAGGNSFDMLMLTEGVTDWYLVVTLEDTIDPLSYNFTVVDTSMNSFTGSSSGRVITDNDDPYLHTDMSDKEAEAGKPFVFKTMASDNIGVASVNVEYWYSFNSQRTTTAMNLLTDNIYYLEIDLFAQPGTLYYIFNTQDVFNPPNSGTTGERTVEILDITPPVIENIDYESTAYTGDGYTVTADVTDDVEVNYVKMWYYYGDEMPDTPMVVDGTPSGDTFSFMITIPDALDPLNFWLVSVDMEANLVETEMFMVHVMDNDLPMMIEDLTDTSAATGELFMFKLNASDNIGIGWVNVTYMLPGGEYMTTTLMAMDMTYYMEMELPNDIKGDMSYYFNIYDTSMNLLTTDEVTLTIVDDEEPVAMIDGPDNEFQHVTVFLSAEGSSDNVGIATYTWEINGEVFEGMLVNYTFDDVGVYTIELKISDGENPTVSTSYDITIRDADDPVIDVTVPEIIGNHLDLMVNASASSDNVGITAYSWLLILPDNTRVTEMGPIFEYPLVGILGDVMLYLTVSDAEGNSVQEIYSIQIVDLLAPTVVVPADIDELEGAYLTFDGTDSFDNTGVTKWVWHISSADVDLEFVDKEMSYFFEIPARYNITLTVFDSANNSASDYFIVNILAKGADYDTDGDGMPDEWEKEVGLDPDLDDSSRDYDGDLLTNLKEYQLKTNPKNADTDGDGMPDKYEYDYGYAEGRTDLVGGIPLWMSEFTAEGDPDEDGDTNIEEYREGYRNPLEEDAPEEKEDNSTTYIAISVVVIILVLLIIIALIFLLGKVKPVQEDFPENQYPHLYKNVEKTEPAPEEK